MTDCGMEEFLKTIERPAFRMAMLACRHREDALDLVQEAMCSFVGKYAGHSEDQWKVLFYKVLQNKIRDFYRREKVRSRWRFWLRPTDDNDEVDPLEQFSSPQEDNPESSMRRKQSFARLEEALEQLSPKQRQVFLLRGWEGLSVLETAQVMACSEGTVKTHFSRATDQLRKKLGDDWP